MITTLQPNTKIEIEDVTIQNLTEQLNSFFIANEKKAFAIAMMSLKNKEDALDVVQDVMIKFVEKYKRKKSSHWCALFYRMIQNRITDFHRANTKQKKYFGCIYKDSDEDIVQHIADTDYVTALEQMDNDIQIQKLQICLNELSTRQLQAFICRIWEGLSVKQTAQSMKCSTGSVKTHLFRALNSIREQMNDNEIENNEVKTHEQ